MRAFGRCVATALAAALFLASPLRADELRDLHFGEVLFLAYQERHFDALARLDAELAQHRRVDEPALDPLHVHADQAEFSVGDFELRYRMHLRAGRAIRVVLESDVAEPVRNEAAYRLAKLHYQKDQPADALRVLDGIEGEIPDAVRDDVAFLRANVYLALGRAGDAANVLAPLQDSEALAGFAAHNRGIALLAEGRDAEAFQQLDRAGQRSAAGDADHAIRDRSNLLLGTLLLESAAYDAAYRSLERVRMDGPYSNDALLRAGWAAASAERYDRAIVPWTVLTQRAPTDAAVQEAMIALPSAHARLEGHGRAAVLYGKAVQAFEAELAKLDSSIASVHEGAFLSALVREEIHSDADWVIRMRELPDAPETFYLMDLMASHDFQTALRNYLDLDDLRRRLAEWEQSLDALDDLVALRRAYYEPALVPIDRSFRSLDARIRLREEQRTLIEKRLQNLLVAPRPESLVTAEERTVHARIDALAARLPGAASSPAAADAHRRVARLRGALVWNLETDYHERLTRAHENLRALDAEMEAMRLRYDAFVRARQAAMHSYAGYDAPLMRLRTRVASAREGIDRLMGAQGQVLERVAVRELEARRDRLAGYQNQARFAFADSYDRAAKAQVR